MADLVTQDLIVWGVPDVGACTAKEGKNRQAKILEPAGNHEYESVLETDRRDDDFGVPIVNRVEDEPNDKQHQQSANEPSQENNRAAHRSAPVLPYLVRLLTLVLDCGGYLRSQRVATVATRFKKWISKPFDMLRKDCAIGPL
jgi:hypothetical protein